MVTSKVVYLKLITLRIRLCIIQVKHKTDCSEKTETSKHELPLLACYGADYCPPNGLTPWVKWVEVRLGLPPMMTLTPKYRVNQWSEIQHKGLRTISYYSHNSSGMLLESWRFWDCAKWLSLKHPVEVGKKYLRYLASGLGMLNINNASIRETVNVSVGFWTTQP